MAQAMTLISSQVLGSSAASVTFSSIPGTYRDLRLVMVLGNDSNTGFGVRFNGDTASNYSYVYAAGNGSGGGSSSGTISYVNIGSNVWDNNTLTSNFTVDVMDYSATDKHKTVLARGNDSATGTEMDASRWANTSAITSVTVIGTGTSKMITGSTLYLYGIVG